MNDPSVRTILFTGKGGVGKSTASAGTAVLAAERGARTLVLSTDPAHSLADAFGTPIGAAPTPIAERLWVQQVDAQQQFEESWGDIRRYLFSVLEVSGMDALAAEEMTVLPGAEEVLALLELRRRAASGEWDVVIVDCAPTAETLRLLALPEALGWYLRRVMPVQRRVIKALRPVLTRAAGAPMPGEDVFDAITRLHTELSAVRDLLAGPGSSARLVLTPEAVVLAEARRAYTNLSLFGYRTDGVVVNRVFPDAGEDPWRSGWVRAQRAVLDEVEASFADLPIWRSEYLPAEPVGVAALGDLARACYGADDPFAGPTSAEPFRISLGRGSAVITLAAPLLDSSQVRLAQSAGELVVTVGPYRRVLTLPSALTRMQVERAAVSEGELKVRFVEQEPGADRDRDQDEGRA